jgi:hypothetical protein
MKRKDKKRIMLFYFIAVLSFISFGVTAVLFAVAGKGVHGVHKRGKHFDKKKRKICLKIMS